MNNIDTHLTNAQSDDFATEAEEIRGTFAAELAAEQEPEPEPQPYDGWEGCWPGDGSGMDDFEDYNQMEGNDY